MEITQVLYRYGRGVTMRDVELVVSCFADDAELDYHGVAAIRGAAEIRAFFAASLAGDRSASLMGLDVARVSTPIVTNALVEVDGDRARSVSSCLAVHAGIREGRETVLVRGTENEDELVRTERGWRITRRAHRVLWSYAVDGQVHLPG